MNRHTMPTEEYDRQEADWAWLPGDVLDKIIHHVLETSSDSNYFRFGAVCKRWHEIAWRNCKAYFFKHRSVPMLLVPTDDNDHQHRGLVSLLIPPNQESRLRRELVPVPVPYTQRCSGSSYGWLAFAQDNLSIVLYNPFTNSTIDLPPLIDEEKPYLYYLDPYKLKRTYWVEYYIEKVILSADPNVNADDCIVCVIYSGMMRVAMKRFNNHDWFYTRIERIKDVIFHKDRLLMVDNLNGVSSINPRAIDLHSLDVQVLKNRWGLFEIENGRKRWAKRVRKLGEFTKHYLIESPDGNTVFKILRVLSTVDPDDEDYMEFKTYGFFVSRLNPISGKWYGVKSLEGNSYFVGENFSICVSISDCPVWLKPNSIYFTDDFNYDGHPYPCGPFDVGVFHLKEGNFGDSFYTLDESQKAMPPALWIVNCTNQISYVS